MIRLDVDPTTELSGESETDGMVPTVATKLMFALYCSMVVPLLLLREV